MSKSKVKRIDPTRTGLLRRKFLAEMNRKFAWLMKEIRKFLVDEDAFGLKVQKPLVLHASPGQYAFTTNPRKLEAFHKWLKEQIDAGILKVSGKGKPGQPWTYEYIDSAYRQGVLRAYIDTNKEALAVSPAWYTGSRAQFLSTAFGLPTTMSKVELLSLRAFDQLTGITATMSQQLSTHLANGLAFGWGPLKIAREMQKSIGTLSRTRARMIARTEIINAHSNGQLDSFTLLGVEKLGILAEWATAGDELVCEICAPMEGKTFTIEEARGLIPLHPNSFAKDVDIYTEDGWINVSRLNKNKKCLSLNPKTFDLEYVPIVGTVRHIQGKMIHFLSNNFDLLVTPEHEMFAKRRERPWTNKRDWEFIQAKHIINETAFYRSSKWVGNDDEFVTIGRQDIPSALFCEFMGWWLSEGCFTNGGKRIIVSQSRKVNPDKYERIVEIVKLLSSKKKKVWEGKEHIYFDNYYLRNYLEQFGKQPVRYIPEEIKRLSAKYIRFFLDAYCLGDGHRRKSKGLTGNFRDELVYATSSKRMADDIGELLIKVGRRPSYHLIKQKGKVLNFHNGSYMMNHDMWIVSECYAQTSLVNKKTGIIKRQVNYNDIVYCVELEKFHTLLCRRNGKVTWAGNCRCAWVPSEVK
jgi:SPP1 gp7 family putative phage head morphogenesis protein